MKHLLIYAKMSDEEIIEKSSSNYGIDIVYAMKIFAEREFCKSILDNIVIQLKTVTKIS